MTAARKSGFSLTENGWKALLLSASGIILVLTIYCLSQGITILFMHLYYFPIVLLAYHYHRKGVVLSVVLGLFYVALVTVFSFPDVVVIAEAFVRFIVFIGIAYVVSVLSETLEQRELERNTIIANSEDGIIIVDISRQVITEVNRRGSDMLGYGAEELVNSTLETIWRDNQERVRFSDTISTIGFTRNFDAHLTQKNGGTRSVLMSAGTLPGQRVVLTVTDITDRERMLSELRKLSDVRESIIKNAHVWLMVLDSRARILEWNHAAEEMSGYPAAEVVGGDEIWKHLYPEKNYRKEITEKIAEIISRNNYLENLQTTVVSKNGMNKTILWNTRGLPDSKGIIGTYIAIGVDITDREHMLSELRKLSDVRESIIKNAHVWLMVLDSRGRVLEWNHAAEEMSGYPAAEVIGGNEIWKHLYPEKNYRKEITEKIAEIISRNNYLENLQTTVVSKNGMNKTILWNTRGLPDTKGIIGTYIAIGVDITEQKQAEKALLESEEKYRAFFTTSRDCVFITTADGRWLDLNDAAVELFGYDSREELMQVNVRDIYADPGERARHLDIVRQTGFSKDFPINLKKKDGTVINTLITSVIRKDPNDNIVGFQGTIRDITERKQAEELRRHFTEELEQQVRSRTQELETSLNEKVVLLREVHHRVKNNFQIILSLLSLQSRDMGDEKVTRAMRESQNRIRAMAFVHETMYSSADFARIDLESYVKYMTAQLFTFYRVRPGTISLILDIKNIFIDINTAIPLGLVINELVSNSLQHAFPEGRKGRITISILDDQKGLTLTFRDNGIGFSGGFDWKATKSLGFSLIRMLIDQLDGTIEREPSEGTLFIIRVMKKTDEHGRLHGTFNQVPE